MRSLADPPTPTSPPSSAAAACLWEVLAYALCKGNLSQEEGERLFAEAAAATSWAVTYKPTLSAAAAASVAAFQTFSATFGSFWKWVCAGASPLPAEYCSSLLRVRCYHTSKFNHRIRVHISTVFASAPHYDPPPPPPSSILALC